jgi:hypothetical protein
VTYDLANPAAPVMLGTTPTVGDAIKPTVDGALAYVASASAAVNVIDLGRVLARTAAARADETDVGAH